MATFFTEKTSNQMKKRAHFTPNEAKCAQTVGGSHSPYSHVVLHDPSVIRDALFTEIIIAENYKIVNSLKRQFMPKLCRFPCETCQISTKSTKAGPALVSRKQGRSRSARGHPSGDGTWQRACFQGHEKCLFPNPVPPGSPERHPGFPKAPLR